MKKAVITGITGQDGSYLARNLVQNGYQVCGVVRNHTQQNHLAKLKWVFGGDIPPEVRLEYSDLTDAPSLTRVVQSFEPDEVYNLAAQSHVGVSFKSPVSTSSANAIGVMNVLEACRAAKLLLSFTRHLRRKCLERLKLFHRTKRRFSIRAVLMVSPNYLGIG